MSHHDWLGYAGAGLIASTFVPQVVKVYRTRNVESFSPVFLALTVASSVCMGLYAVLTHTLPVFIANFVVFICSVSLGIMYVAYSTNSTNSEAVIAAHGDA